MAGKIKELKGKQLIIVYCTLMVLFHLFCEGNLRSKLSHQTNVLFQDIPEGFTATYAYGKKTENKHKNRFVNIIACEFHEMFMNLE